MVKATTYIYNTQTGEKSLFFDGSIEEMVPYGDYLYYFWYGIRADDADSGLYRMKQDQSENQMLFQTSELFSLNIAGDKLFWETNNELRQPTTANLDGTDIHFIELAP
ncbi:MAG: DUF5050 domain-containing protein [Eubacteriales bacterium]|nr:DUF5050 domain-containing protein [Eubacteriales bacterium]MDD4541414.1 DUF5050 domain-containing protein [Eubacteriales bacterium]